MKRAALVAGAVLVLVCLGYSPAAALWSNDPTVNNLIYGDDATQWPPSIVSDDDGGAVIIWMDGREPVADRGLYAQRVAADGALLWPADGVRLMLPWEVYSVTTDGAGGAIVSGTFYTTGYVVSQRVNASGDILWGTEGTDVRVGGVYPSWVDSAGDGENGAIIVWCEHLGGAYNLTVVSQRIDASGVRVWAPEGLHIGGTLWGHPGEYYTTALRVISDGAGGAIIVWVDDGLDVVCAQRVSGSGELLWGAGGIDIGGMPVASDSGHGLLLAVAGDGAGGAVLCWASWRGGLYAQRVDAAGDALWAVDGVQICGTCPDCPLLVSDGAGGGIAAWTGRPGGGEETRVQRVGASGDLLWADGGVVVCRQFAWTFDLVTDGDGGAILAWSEDRALGFYDIYAQRVDALGDLRWGANGAVVCAAPFSEWDPRLATDGAGGAIVTWRDWRSGNWDIYAQLVDKNGRLGHPSLGTGAIIGGVRDLESDNAVTQSPDSSLDDAPIACALRGNYPNPFNPVTRIEFDLPEPAAITLEIFDVTGRFVRTLVDGHETAGRKQTFWDGTDERGASVASGVYYCRMTAPGYERTSKMTLLK